MKGIVLGWALLAGGISFGEGMAGERISLRFPKDSEVTDTTALMRRYFEKFAADDEELYTNAYANAVAFDVMKDNVPRFACPDGDVTETYYFRWWTYRKHLKKTPLGWVITEFLPPVPWAGYANAIICPAGHHIMEGRWLRDTRYVEDDVRFWSATEEGRAVRRRYASWIATAALEAAKVRGDVAWLMPHLEHLVAFYREWEEHPVLYRAWAQPDGFTGLLPMGGDGKGMFTSLDGHEGTEYTLSGDGYRPLFNAAMYGEARAIVELARRAGRQDLATAFENKAAVLARGIREKLWNRDVGFFVTVKTNGTVTAVRELHGYAPWYFGVPLEGRPYERAWAPLVRKEGFLGAYGLTFPEQAAPGYALSYSGHECQWNGPSWPYATSIALSALRRAVWDGTAGAAAGETFARLVKQYAAAQVRVLPDGRRVKWIDENLNPRTGDWMARTILDRTPEKKRRMPRERGKDYNHSTFCDLVISGLCGLRPGWGARVEVKPLAPAAWDWWCLENVWYHGRPLTILFDRDGTHFGKGKGLMSLDSAGPKALDRPAP